MLEQKWTDIYYVIIHDYLGEMVVRTFPNNIEVTEYLEEQVNDCGLDPLINAVVIKADAATSGRLLIETQKTVRVSVG